MNATLTPTRRKQETKKRNASPARSITATTPTRAKAIAVEEKWLEEDKCEFTGSTWNDPSGILTDFLMYQYYYCKPGAENTEHYRCKNSAAKPGSHIEKCKARVTVAKNDGSVFIIKRTNEHNHESDPGHVRRAEGILAMKKLAVEQRRMTPSQVVSEVARANIITIEDRSIMSEAAASKTIRRAVAKHRPPEPRTFEEITIDDSLKYCHSQQGETRK